MSWTILDQSVTGETQWFNASYGPALSTVADALLGSITQQTVGASCKYLCRCSRNIIGFRKWGRLYNYCRWRWNRY